MDKDERHLETKKSRGRPPLSPEMKERRRIEYNKRSNECHKSSGYAAQKRFRKEKCFEPKLLIPLESREILNKLLTETNMTVTTLFLDAIESKYGIKLKKD